MDWIRENSVFILFFVVMMAMHLFGHGMRGGHGGPRDGEEQKEQPGAGKKPQKGGHGCC